MREFPKIIQVQLGDPRLEAAFAEAERGVAIGQQVVQRESGFIPNLIQARRRLASWYDRFLQGSRAIQDYQEVLRLDPADPEARHWLADAEGNTGRKLLPS